MGRPKGSKNKPKENGMIDDSADEKILHGKAAKTLRGDVRDALLREFKSMQFTWNMMKEDEQSRIIRVTDDIASMVVNYALLIAASEGAPHIETSVGKIEIADGLKLHLTAAGSLDNITKLASNRGPAVLVLIEPSKFHGQRKVAEPDVVGDLRMPRGQGLTGDDIIDITPEKADDVPPGLRRLPPPGPDYGETPFS